MKQNWPYAFSVVPLVGLATLNFLAGNTGFALVNLASSPFALAISILFVRRSRSRLMKVALAEWGVNETDIEGELAAISMAPQDWHLVIRGKRYYNLEFVYLGPIVVGDRVCPHWRAIKPLEVPNDVTPEEVEIRGQVTEACVVDVWFGHPC